MKRMSAPPSNMWIAQVDLIKWHEPGRLMSAFQRPLIERLQRSALFEVIPPTDLAVLLVGLVLKRRLPSQIQHGK